MITPLLVLSVDRSEATISKNNDVARFALLTVSVRFRVEFLKYTVTVCTATARELSVFNNILVFIKWCTLSNLRIPEYNLSVLTLELCEQLLLLAQ